MSLRHQAASGVRWTTAATVATASAQLVQLIVLARLLSPSDFGLMAMVTVVLGFVQAFTDVGISSAIIYRQDITVEQRSSLYWLNLVAGLLFFGVMWLTIPAIVFFFQEPKLTPLLRTASAVFLIVPPSKQFEVLLQKDLRFDVLAKQQIAAAAISTIAALAAALAGFGVWSLLLGQLGLIALRSAMLFPVGWQQYRPAFGFSWDGLGSFLSFGLYQIGERCVNYLAQSIDQILIGRLLGAQTLGYYNFAYNLVIQPYRIINPTVTKVAFPVFAKIQNDISRLQQGYLKTVHLLTMINAPILLGIAALSPVIVPIVFGNKWSNSIVLIQILAVVALLRSVANPVGSLLLAKGRARLAFVWNLVVLVASIPIVVFAATMGGAIGVASLLVIWQVVLQVASYYWLMQPLIGSCGAAYTITLARPIMLSVVMAVVVIGVGKFAPVSWVGIALQIGAGILCFAFLILKFDRISAVELIGMILGAQHKLTKRIIAA